MIALAVLVLSIGLADAVNPSTVAPALYLALGRDAVGNLARFTAGVFFVYLLGGVGLTLGPGSALPHPGRHLTHLIELGLGRCTHQLPPCRWATPGPTARRCGGAWRPRRRSSLLFCPT